MEKLLKVFVVLFVTQICFGQQVKVYEFEPKHTHRKIKEFKEAPIVYSVDHVTFEKTIAVGLVPILNNDYILLERNIKKLEKDSVVYHNKLAIASKRQNDLLKIKTLINDFIASPKDFDSKKENLISAQGLAEEYGLLELIYADENINPNKRAKFMVLKIDKLDLKVHLKRIVWRIEDMFIPLPVSKSLIDENLQKLRRNIKGVEKYNYKDGGYKKLTRKGMVIKNKVHNFDMVEGEFEQLGTYYILYNGYKKIFKQGEIVNQRQAIKNNLIDKGYTSVPRILMKQVKTNKLFLADLNFVNQYAFLINGKFNRGKLPLGSYKESSIVLSDD